MKRILIIALLTITVCHPAPGQIVDKKSNPGSNPDQISIPRIRILYPPNGTIFDRQCPELMKTTIKPEWVQETVRRVPEFQALWDKDGAAYLSATLAEIGLTFPYREMQVTLTVCPTIRGGSLPLMVNTLPYLSSVQAEARQPVSLDLFVETVFHEVMHHYTPRVYASSALYKKYATESPIVLSHLHVAAIEKFVLLKLGKAEVLKLVDRAYRNSPIAGYKRAWEIVNDLEGYEPFIKELKLLRN